MNRLAAVILALGLCLPPLARAVNCHCFQDRKFDPAAPAKTDDFLLATARNALAAAAFGSPKGDVVRARMGGASDADLWIAYRAAQSAAPVASAPAPFLEARAKAPSWKAALASLHFDPKQLGAPFAEALS